MTVIVTDREGSWRMVDVIWVDGGALNPKVATLFQVADVDTDRRHQLGQRQPCDSHLSNGLTLSPPLQ